MTEQSKPPVVAGKGMAAIVPQDVDQTFRLAQALAASGDMVPKHFQNRPNEVMAAIMRGMEIGLAPMQAISNIAVINGRASLWGDALPALMQRAGHHLDAEIIGEGDEMKAVATLVRGDTGRKITREFSVEDAKKANLWGKQGPWQTYPKRMLMMRARAWAVRDGASDAMMGLQVAEEAQDMPIKDVTPPEPLEGRRNLAQSIMGADTPEEPSAAPEPPEAADEAIETRHSGVAAGSPETTPQGSYVDGPTQGSHQQDQIEDAEVVLTLDQFKGAVDEAGSKGVLEAIGKRASELAPEDVAAARTYYGAKLGALIEAEGRAAFAEGKQDTDCPYEHGSSKQKRWLDGFFAAQQEQETAE